MLTDPTVNLPPCPVCAGTMEVVYSRFKQVVAVCTDCHAGLTVPDNAWRIARMKAVEDELKPKKTG